MSTAIDQRVAIAFSLLLVFSVVAPVSVGSGQSSAHATNEDFEPFEQVGQYKVSIDNVTVQTWALRNVTVRNATAESVVVRNLSIAGETRRNVMLRNVSLAELDIDNGTLDNVTANRIVVRNRSIWDVPGGDLFDPGVRDRVVERHVLANVTVEGAALDRLVVANMTVRNASVPPRSDESQVADEVADPSTDPRPAIEVRNASVASATIRNATAGNWSVESVGSSGNSTEG